MELARTLSQKPEGKLSLKARQQQLNNRIQITQAVLPGELLKSGVDEPKSKKKMTFKEASKRVIARQRLRVSDVVSECVARMEEQGETDVTSTLSRFGKVTPPSIVLASQGQYTTQISDGESGRRGSVPLHMWRRIASEHCPTAYTS